MSTTKKKSTVKKAAAKKTGAKKTAAKKTGAKKTAKKAAARKTTAKKTTTKKTAVKKTAVKKTAASKADHDHGELSRIAAENLHAVAADIDRQMKNFRRNGYPGSNRKGPACRFPGDDPGENQDFPEKACRQANGKSYGHHEVNSGRPRMKPQNTSKNQRRSMMPTKSW